MALCKWEGGACERETDDKSGLCSLHRRDLVKGTTVDVTTAKTKAFYFVAGALLAVFALYPLLKDRTREQTFGLMLLPEDVKATCGQPQVDAPYKLTYAYGDQTIELRFMAVNHRMFLNYIQWNSGTGSGNIRRVTADSISNFVKSGSLPPCLEQTVH